jgi:hypothetical protein
MDAPTTPRPSWRERHALLRRFARPLSHGLVIAGLLFGAYLFIVVAPSSQSVGFDAFAYWNVSLPEPYTIPVGALGSFNYSPPLALVAEAFSIVDWWVFWFLWTMLLVGTVVWIAGSPTWILVAFALPFVALELYHGNIHILLAAAIVLGFRHPWTWAFVLLAKPTAGVGLLWFVVRREWRSLWIALGTTAAICLVSLLAMPSMWVDWIDLLLRSPGTSPLSPNVFIPLWVRLPIAALLVIWGARTDRRWTVVVSSMLALPVLWFAAPAMLIGIIPELRGRSGGSLDLKLGSRTAI